MKIIDYFEYEDKKFLIDKLHLMNWFVKDFLIDLLENNKFKTLCGEKSKFLMLFDEENLVSFLSLVEQDEIRDTNLTPWIGFVYTFEEYRNKGYIRILIDYAVSLCDSEYVYVSTNHTELYEKLNFEYFTNMLDMTGNDSRIYRRKVRK